MTRDQRDKKVKVRAAALSHWFTMTETNSIDISKKLSTESRYLLDELGRISTTAADLVPRLYKSLEDDGLKHSEIFGIIQEKIDISRRRLYDLIPPESKRPYKKVQKLHNSNVQKLDNQARLVTDQEPQIPPSPSVVRELDPAKFEDEPTSPTYEMPPESQPRNAEIFLSCRKFNMELRLGCANNSVLKLRLNMNNEVVEIT